MSMTNETLGLEKQRDNSNFFVRFFKYFVPWKGDGAGEVIRKIIFVGSIVLFCSSINQLTDFLETDKETLEYSAQIQSLEPDFSDEVNIVGAKTGGKDGSDAPEAQKRQVQEWAKDLQKRNKEVVGWIKIPGFCNSDGKEYINFPVLQHEDNDWYLTHNIDNQPYESGSIYADYLIPINADGQADNITIYGHHMRKLGTSFTHLAEYKSGIKFLRKHPIIEFNTIYESNQEYAIISCFVAAINESQDNGHLFDYWRYRNFDDGDYKFSTWLDNIAKASWYSVDIQCDPEDDYITLSTCSNEVANMRWVIIAKKLDEDDDKEAVIASYQDKKDKDIYFPQVWRNVWGNSRKYLGWAY
ncbi:sortase B [Ruminococcus sp. YE71]|nr:sortase B [Ruminococcus sp. YE78]SFW28839.1 sortase B [Ruminococcus sp. YE71]